MFFLAELAEKTDNPFFHHGVYRGKVEDDMLVHNSSVFLSVDYSRCKNVAEKLLEKGMLYIRSGDQRTISYSNYYYYTGSFVSKERMLEEIGSKVLEEATKAVNEHQELIEPLGLGLVYRYKGFRYVNEEKITVDPELITVMIENCLLLKNRFVYTGGLSGINFFIPDAPFFNIIDYLNKKFLVFFFNRLATSGFGDLDNYEEMREKILSNPKLKKLGLTHYDTKIVDYIFDLSESLEVPIPTRYLQVYNQYKESIISIKVLERVSPLIRGSVETLEDSIRHYKKRTMSDYRLALINIDNSIELILRNHVLKKIYMNLEDVKKISFERLLKKCRDIETVDNNLDKFKQIHGARNQMYHMPLLGGPDRVFIKDALNLTKHLFEEETSEKLKVKL